MIIFLKAKLNDYNSNDTREKNYFSNSESNYDR